MLKSGEKEITSLYIGKRAISSVYVGMRLVWAAVRSCFGCGYWKSDSPWNRSDGWRR